MEPPPLLYDIASKKRSIAINGAIIVLCNVLIPLGLYYGLRFGSNLNQVLVVSIAQLSMTVAMLQLIYRWWLLLRNSGECAPRDRTIWTLDHFQWQFIFGAILATALCVVSSIIGSVRLFALVPVVVFAEVAFQFVLTACMSRAGIHTLFRVSSQPAGAVTRPLLYTFIEDLTACDGGGGTQYRTRLNERYISSPPFRELMYTLSLYLGISVLLVAVMTMVLIVVLPGDVSFGVSMVLLWSWSGVYAALGVLHAIRALGLEKEWWERNAGKHDGVLASLSNPSGFEP